MTQISFTSRILPVSRAEFFKRTANFTRDGFVDYPWMISSGKIAQNVYSTNFCDCSGCLVNDGLKAGLEHLNPAIESNHSYYKICKFFTNNFDMNSKNIQAVLIGGQNTKESIDIFNLFYKFITEFKIPATILKFGKMPTNIAYRTGTDEIFVSNKAIEKALKNGEQGLEALKKGFEYVKISPLDEV